MTIPASQVHQSIGAHLLDDAMPWVLDLERSSGSTIVDARTGTEHLDMFTFFASSPLGMNHPALVEDHGFRAALGRAALNKPSNSDAWSAPMAEFVATFARVLGDPALPHYFFIDGGALAVENALKAAFDWKSRHNEAHGRDSRLGTKVLHLTGAFHGRSGYTMSLTNTDPGKVARFPQFDWPRISTPDVHGDHTDGLLAAEERSLAEARDAFAAHPDDIACFLAEPIQGEGGDRHLSPRYLRAMQELCHAHDALFVLDEVQTGCGLTGHPWAYQGLGLEPDVVAFGKKVQVCGLMAGRRVDDVADNVFRVSSRINSTWGGNLTDMVRSRRILEVIESERLIDNAAARGTELLHLLTALSERQPIVSNPRGRGLMCAVDLPDPATRDAVLAACAARRMVALGCGTRSIRFRPALTVDRDTLHRAVEVLDLAIADVGRTRDAA